MDRGVLSIAAGILVIGSLITGAPMEAMPVLALALVIVVGGLMGRLGSLVSAVSSVLVLAMLWIAFDRLVGEGRLDEVGIGALLALLGGLVGAAAGVARALPESRSQRRSRLSRS